MHLDTDELYSAQPPAAKKRKWWEDSLSNGLVQLDLDNAGSQQQQQQQRQAEDQALRLFGEVSEDLRPSKKLTRR